MSCNIGPQCKSDPCFMARMRFHQSWYRANVLGVPYGTGPKASDTSEWGNMLTRESGAKGLNFLTPEIFKVVKHRLEDTRGTIDKYRLLHNMLSSQPMCFNLFSPLVVNHDLATKVLKLILPNEVKKVVDVKIEYAPEPACEYLNDRTAFDAFVDFIRPDNKRGFVGIETKLTEPFSQKDYDTPIYHHWTELDDSPWPKESWPYLADIKHNQLWRDHLLAVAMSWQSPYTCGFLMLVHHPEDKECIETVNNYKKLIKPDDQSFLDCPLDKLVCKMGSCLGDADASLESWLAEFRERYLDIYLSEKGWLRSINANTPKKVQSKKRKIRMERFIGDGSELELIGNIDEVEITDRE
ncbi:MAG TPA: hypothetical protein VMW16_01175 [Sedimentisphaerales bacterium]|nr:hypothetical protein [Sedimentisphaerales bacterium]